MLTVNAGVLVGDITTDPNGIEYDYFDKKALILYGLDELKSINGCRYHAGNKYHKTDVKSYSEMVRAYSVNMDNFMYDCSDNGFDLVNKGTVWTTNGAYFPTNEDVRYRGQYQEDMHRIELRGEKLNELAPLITSSVFHSTSLYLKMIVLF